MKKKSKIIFKVVQALVILLTIYIFSSSIIGFATGNIPTIFNRNYFIVQTDSMEETIMVNDLIVSRKEKIENVKENDIITFVCIDPNEIVVNQVITHRVVKIEVINDEILLTTKGDNVAIEDKYKVSEDNFIGIVTYKSSFFGKIISFISNGGFLILIFIILLLIGTTFLKQVKEYKNAKNEESEAQRKERLKLELLKEIKEDLKNQKE